ncbi:MAG: gfo/Idh/MocA family oxidoreductase [Gammaproteobacteria bacterium]|nr:MAG: gfo/Idh/MocA family oxidoreductase [Gammaproteobacteria bacterium]
MINAAIVGLGWWGKTLVESVSGISDDIRFVAATTRSLSDDAKEFATEHDLELRTSYEDILTDPNIDAVVLVTPNSLHSAQTIAAAEQGKHVFCEKPFSITKADATAAVEACDKAGVTLGVGYNRRFHPEMTKLRDMINSGELGTILHCEATMTFPNGLFLKPDAWRASKDETPCGGLTPLGVHAVDGFIDLCGEIDQVYAQSFRRVVEVDADDTTSILFRMKDGMSGYLATMTATGGGFNFQVYGSKGFVKLEGMTHIAGAPSEERRFGLFGNCTYKPVKGPAETWQADPFDVARAALDAFARAAAGGEPFMIPTAEIVHGAAVTEAIVNSAGSGQPEKL